MNIQRIWIAMISLAHLLMGPTALADHTPDSLRFGNIEIVSSIPLDKRLEQVRERYSAMVVSENKFVQFSNELLRFPPRQGYHFPILVLESVDPVESEAGRFLNPTLHLNWGKIAQIDTILFQGVEKTRSSVLTRTLKSFNGTVYTLRSDEQIKRALRRFPFLTLVAQNEIVKTRDGQTGLLMTIREQQDNEFTGVAGYVPETVTKKGYLTGELDLKFHNLSGTGRQLYLYWSKTNRYSQQIKINYREPWIWKSNLFGTAGFEQVLRDTLLVIRDVGLGSGFYSLSYGSMAIRFSREATIPTPAGREQLGIGNTMSSVIGLDYSIDRRNSTTNPSSGFTFSSQLSAGTQQRDSLNRISRYELGVNGSVYVPLRKELVLATQWNARGKWLYGEEPGYAEQFWFGGASSLRGYPEEFFRGSRIAWGSLELRRLIGEFSSFYAFFDQGYYFRKDAGQAIHANPYSYGVGIRLATRMGIVGIDYGFGENDTFSTAKIHIRLISRF